MSSRAPIFLLSAAAVAVALVAVAWPGGQASGATPGAVHGTAELIECKRSKQTSGRRVVFRGEMTQIAGATRMALRVRLYEKVGSDPWRRVWAPGVNLLREADPGVKRFAYRQRVLGLKKGASYRAEIVFRWYAADGAEVRREAERSPSCRQPGKLPNLVAARVIDVADGPTPGTRHYAVRVGNIGSVTAQRIDLGLFVDGAEVDSRRIGRLGAGQRREVGFIGPACRQDVVVRVDPKDLIPEITEQDNAVTVPCDELVPR